MPNQPQPGKGSSPPPHPPLPRTTLPDAHTILAYRLFWTSGTRETKPPQLASSPPRARGLSGLFARFHFSLDGFGKQGEGSFEFGAMASCGLMGESASFAGLTGRCAVRWVCLAGGCAVRGAGESGESMRGGRV